MTPRFDGPPLPALQRAAARTLAASLLDLYLAPIGRALDAFAQTGADRATIEHAHQARAELAAALASLAGPAALEPAEPASAPATKSERLRAHASLFDVLAVRRRTASARARYADAAEALRFQARYLDAYGQQFKLNDPDKS